MEQTLLSRLPWTPPWNGPACQTRSADNHITHIMPGSARRYELLRKRLDAFTRVLPGVGHGDVRALHRARVASRRLRELIPVLQLDDETAARLTRRLRKVTTRLGHVRELDVLLLLVDELAGSGRQSGALDRVRDAIARARTAARDELASDRTASGLERLATRLHDVLTVIEERAGGRGRRHEAGAPAAWKWAVAARIARRGTRLREAIGRAGTVYVPERLHDVRIALKKLRYALELDADVRGLKTTPELRALRRGQDLLGRLHDLQVLIARARQVRDDAGAPGAAAEIDRLVDALETDCRHLHARYLRERAALDAVADRARAASARRTAAAPARLRRSA